MKTEKEKYIDVSERSLYIFKEPKLNNSLFMRWTENILAVKGNRSELR